MGALSSAVTPKISIVIPCFNARSTVEATLRSVLSQDVQAHEVIVQDGGSRDGTLEVLERYVPTIQYASEPDSGQSDAVNRAIHRSCGDVIGWLNADDVYTPGTLRSVSEAFQQDPSLDVVYGDHAMIDEAGHRLRRYYVSELDWHHVFTRGSYIFSGAIFFHRRVFERFGGLDETLHCCMDSEFLLRISRAVRSRHIPAVFAAQRIHDAAKSSGIPLQFVREGLRVRWRYSQGSIKLRLAALWIEAMRFSYICTRRVWVSSLWARLRPEKRL